MPNRKTQDSVMMITCIPSIQSALNFFMTAILIFWSCVVPNYFQVNFHAGGFGGIEWIDLAQDRDRWWAVANSVMNFWVP